MMTEDKEEITPVGKRQYKRGKERRQDILMAVVMLLSNPKPERFVRQTLKLAVVNREIAADTNVARCAEVYVSFVTGRWLRFSQSGFTKRPTEGWSFAEALLSLTEL